MGVEFFPLACLSDTLESYALSTNPGFLPQGKFRSHFSERLTVSLEGRIPGAHGIALSHPIFGMKVWLDYFRLQLNKTAEGNLEASY